MRFPRRRLLAACPAVLAAPFIAIPAMASSDAKPSGAASRSQEDSVGAAISAHEKATGGRIGVYAEDLSSGRIIGWRAHERFVMCSTFKMSLVACVLSRVDHRSDSLGEFVPFHEADLLSYAPVAREHLAEGRMTVETMCQAAVELSDNTCANLLLARIGGPAALTRFWRTTGDAVSRLDHNEPDLNRSPPGDPHDTTTPAAMAGNLRRFVLGNVLLPDSRTRLTQWLVNCKTGDGLLRAGLPPTWKVADKTGNSGADAMADIAVAWRDSDRPLLICAYTQGGTPSQAQLKSVIADVGRLAATA
jgi:beta-lactamase class A